MQYTALKRALAFVPSYCTNDLTPDSIPTQKAALTSDEVRTISLICPFLILPGGKFGEEDIPVQHVMSQLPWPLIESELILSSVRVSHRETFQTLL